MKILVMGASGFIGSQLTEHLSDLGMEVWGVSRHEEKLSHIPSKQRVITDLMAPDGRLHLCNEIKKHAFDAVINSAALCDSWGKKRDFYSVNVAAAEASFAACQEVKVPHYLHISSPSVFAELKHNLNIADDAAFPASLNYYASSKQEAEKKLRERVGLGETKLSILRPQAVFGNGDPHLFPRLLKANSLRGIPLINGGQHLIDITPVENVVRAIVCLLKARDYTVETFNLSERNGLDFKTLLERMFLTQGEVIRWKPVSLNLAKVIASGCEILGKLTYSPREPLLTRYALSVLAYSRTLNSEKIRQQLDYQPVVTIDQAISQLKQLRYD